MQLIPDQYIGRSIQATSSREFFDDSSAGLFFDTIKQRLQRVNDWQSLAGASLANFTLVNSNGEDVCRPPMKGDHFKINVPGPGSIEGQGYDWVQIEAIYQEVEADSERYGFTVRPSSNPNRSTTETAHFYSDESTSTFLVKREGKLVSAEVYDRNITPNTENKMQTETQEVVKSHSTKNMVKVKPTSVPPGLTKTLGEPQYKGWQRGNLYFNKSTKEYALLLPTESPEEVNMKFNRDITAKKTPSHTGWYFFTKERLPISNLLLPPSLHETSDFAPRAFQL